MAFDAPYFYGAGLPTAVANKNAVAQVVLGSNPQLFECFEAGIDVHVGAIAWGAFQNSPNSLHIGAPKVGIVSDEGNALLDHDALVLATGVRDFVPSFRGWDLPGVFGVKGGVTLLDTYQCYEGKRTLVLGTSERAVDFVRRAIARGVEIVGMIEPSDGFFAGADAAAEIAAFGIPIHFNCVIDAAEGQVAVERARLVRVNGSDTSATVDCDTICIAIGILPNVELAAAMGCRMRFDAAEGTWVPEINPSGKTSLEGVFWLSDFTRGSAMLPAVLEGIEDSVSGRIEPDQLAASKIAQADYLRLWIRSLYEQGGGGVMFCQCENVSRDDFLGLNPPAYLGAKLRNRQSPVEKSNGEPLIHQDQIKRMTRVGMGHCQGKRCHDEAALLLSIRFGIGLAHIKPASYRFPVRPLDLALIAAEDDTFDTREKWSYWLHTPEIH
jgi:thioredoxin reductase